MRKGLHGRYHKIITQQASFCLTHQLKQEQAPFYEQGLHEEYFTTSDLIIFLIQSFIIFYLGISYRAIFLLHLLHSTLKISPKIFLLINLEAEEEHQICSRILIFGLFAATARPTATTASPRLSSRARPRPPRAKVAPGAAASSTLPSRSWPEEG